MGLLAPEMVAYAAWVQLRAARRLDKKMKRLLGEAPTRSLRDKFWRLLRAGKDVRCKSTSGRDEEGNYTEQHNESQTYEENMGSRQFNVARGDQPPGTATYETRPRDEDGPETSHDSVTMDPKLTSPKIAFAGNRHRLVDQHRNDESCVSYGSETRHQTTVDEADTELHEEYGGSSHCQPESARPTTLPDGKRDLKKRRHPWTMTHSFYAIMGGLAFDTSDAAPNFLLYHRSRLCISAYGLGYIAEKAPELIPDIAEKHINDKSKADSLAKFLVCLQALWFCVQCMTRVTQRKAISLLELNTFAHAFCALLIYALWWHKPQDVEEPTLLQGEKEWEMCAFLCMKCSHGDVDPEFIGGIALGDETLRIEPTRLRRVELYSNATKSFKGRDDVVLTKVPLCDSIPHWPLTLSLKESELLRVDYRGGDLNTVLLGLILSGLLYGGLHLLAWKMPFASRTECILWRFSGIFIISTGLGFRGLTGFYGADIVWRNVSENRRDPFGRLLVVLSILLSSAICLGYLLARTFLVVECFLQLSRLTPSAYETPAWSAYFPHIS